jgi:hypothetical protein
VCSNNRHEDKLCSRIKKIVLVCEEGNSKVEVISNLLVPQNNKTILAQKP